jgi:hypothetical protein
MRKEERKNRGGRKGSGPMYNTRVPASLVPLMHYRVPRSLTPFLVGPGIRSKGAKPNGTFVVVEGGLPLGRGQEVLSPRCQDGRH